MNKNFDLFQLVAKQQVSTSQQHSLFLFNLTLCSKNLKLIN